MFPCTFVVIDLYSLKYIVADLNFWQFTKIHVLKLLKPLYSYHQSITSSHQQYYILSKICSSDQDVFNHFMLVLQSLIGLIGLGPSGTFNVSSRYIHQVEQNIISNKNRQGRFTVDLFRKFNLFLPSVTYPDIRYWHLQHLSLLSRVAFFHQKLFNRLVSDLSGHLDYASPVPILGVEIDPGHLQHCTRCSLVAWKSWL